MKPQHESIIQKAVGPAARRAGIPKRVTTHTFRHSFATHLLEDQRAWKKGGSRSARLAMSVGLAGS